MHCSGAQQWVFTPAKLIAVTQYGGGVWNLTSVNCALEVFSVNECYCALTLFSFWERKYSIACSIHWAKHVLEHWVFVPIIQIAVRHCLQYLEAYILKAKKFAEFAFQSRFLWREMCINRDITFGDKGAQIIKKYQKCCRKSESDTKNMFIRQ